MAKIHKNILKAYWIQDSINQMKSKGTIGSLHKALGIDTDKKIPMSKLLKASKGKGDLARKARWALNIRRLLQKGGK